MSFGTPRLYTLDTVIPFGKYKGRTFRDVVEAKDWSYIAYSGDVEGMNIHESVITLYVNMIHPKKISKAAELIQRKRNENNRHVTKVR